MQSARQVLDRWVCANQRSSTTHQVPVSTGLRIATIAEVKLLRLFKYVNIKSTLNDCKVNMIEFH